jgi:hypothetical protein
MLSKDYLAADSAVFAEKISDNEFAIFNWSFEELPKKIKVVRFRYFIGTVEETSFP